MLIHLQNEADFEKEIAGELVLVDFYADWCGPCQMLAPELEQLAKEEGVKVVKINVDELGGLAQRYGVMSIPTMILFKEGKNVKKQVGYLPLAHLKTFIHN